MTFDQLNSVPTASPGPSLLKRLSHGVAIGTIAVLALSSCAGSRSGPEATSSEAAEIELEDEAFATASVNDPIEPLNRYIFEFNLFFDDIVLEPTARAYRTVVPQDGRSALRNFIDNLGSPVVFANDVLQGEFNRAGITLSRFVINSTVGVAGLLDPAEAWGYKYHDEDFGQTLGTYGVGEGPYFMAPFLGPAPPRDLAGRVVDIAFDPFTWMGGETVTYVQVGTTIIDVVDVREVNLETFDEIERTSLDLYATVRSAYRQARNAAIANGQPSEGDSDDLFDVDFQGMGTQ